jgi:hypothetical protein
MVDFNNETTITTSPKIIVKIMLLERRKFVIDALEFIYKNKRQGLETNADMLRSRLLSLMYEMYYPLVAAYGGTELNQMIADCKTKRIEVLEDIYSKVDKWFYEKGLTKIDTNKIYDMTDAEEENKARGF